MEYKVPRVLWENFEAVLLAQSKKYIEELATRLQVSAKELQKRVMPSTDSIKVLLQESTEDVCKAYIQHDQFTIFCRKPVINAQFCSEHCNNRMMIVDADKAISIQRIKDRDSMPPMWLIGNDIYYSNGELAGKINHETQKIKIFIKGK
jgi:hypothetical protein